MRLRRARPEDLAAVGETTVAAYAPFTRGPTDPYIDRLRDAEIRDREAEIWVATPADDEEILGSVTICPPWSPWREVARDDEGEFRMLSVSPHAQGRGVGTALVGLVLERFRTDGARAVVMSSLPMMSDAHRVYARAGFTRLPERDFDPVPGVHLIAFGKEL